jgi:proline dehydrogenase
MDNFSITFMEFLVKAVNEIIVKFVQLMPKSLVRLFANSYIAGDTLDEAVALVKKLNADGIMATMDVLGESITSKDEAIDAKKQAFAVLDAIHEHKLNSNLSIKPTQFGLLLDEEFCFQQVHELLGYAKARNNFIRLDMEDSTTTDRIIALYERCRKEFSNVGIVVQACLRRTVHDVELMNRESANYRLCKGIYIEPVEIAYRNRQEVRDNYLTLLRLMLENKKYTGIATHDDYLLNGAKALIKELGIQPDAYEFQMLLGVRADLRNKLVKEGNKLRVYVPFGKQWYAYSIRRLKENPNMAMDIFKNLFRM